MERLLVGRRQELAAVDETLRTAADGPRALILAGEPGIGKTRLWAEGLVRGERRGFSILSCQAGEFELRLALAGLGDLLGPLVPDCLELVPTPQREALERALLLSEVDGEPTDPRALGLAVLGVLRAAARERPLLVAIDDLQWLDEPSLRLLEFSCRRLRDEPVVLLATRRSVSGGCAPALERALGEDRLRSITVGPLSLGAIHELLRLRLGLQLPRPLLRRREAGAPARRRARTADGTRASRGADLRLRPRRGG